MNLKVKKPIVTRELHGGMITLREVKSGRYEAYSPPNYIEPHRRNYFVFFLVKTGSIKHSIDFKTYDCRPRNLFFMAPHQIYLVETAQNIGGLTLTFKAELLSDSEMLSPVVQNLHVNNKIELHPEQYVYVDDLLTKMLSEYEGREIFSQELLRSYLRTILFYLGRVYNQQNKPGQPSQYKNELVIKFRSLLSSEWDKLSNVSAYAGRLHVTPGHLNRVMNQETGKNAGGWIREKRLLEIKRLLLHSGDSIKEIGYKAGFDDPAYFTRFFRNATGATPLAFRMEIRENYHTKQ
jgi:AraC-like DNA-binding protein